MFGGKTISHENFASFGLGSHRNRFSKKHVFGPNFFTKQHHSNYRGQTDYMARLGAKLFRSEVSYLWKNTFMGRIFLLNRPLTYFRGETDCLVCLGAKLFRTKTSLYLASEATEIVFPKNTSSVRIFLLNSTTATIGAKWTICRDWGQNCSEAKFRISEKTCLWSEFFY